MAEIDYYASNPPDWTATFTRVRVERAPDNSGSPGAFAEIANVLIDTRHEYTKYADGGGTSTSWYRHRWADAGGATFSDYSDNIQAGDSPVRQNAVADITAADITTAMWDRWMSESLQDMFALGIWYPARATITPTTTTPGVVDEYYPIDQRLRDVFACELVDATTLKHIEWLIEGPEWKQYGGELRLIDASTTWKIVAHGKAQFKTIGELTDDFFSLLLAMAKVKYYQKRYDERMDFIAYMVADPRTDVSPESIGRALQLKQAAVNTQVSGLALAEPAIEASWGMT